MALNTSKCNHLMSLPFKGLTTFPQCWWLKTVMEENTWHICLHVGRVFRCRARICRCLGVVWACDRSDDRTAASVRTGCRRRLPVCAAPRTHHPAQAKHRHHPQYHRMNLHIYCRDRIRDWVSRVRVLIFLSEFGVNRILREAIPLPP